MLPKEAFTDGNFKFIRQLKERPIKTRVVMSPSSFRHPISIPNSNHPSNLYRFQTCLYILKNTYEGTRSRSGRDLLNDDNSGKQGPSKRQLRVSNLIQVDLS